jgi:hypothetical protein
MGLRFKAHLFTEYFDDLFHRIVEKIGQDFTSRSYEEPNGFRPPPGFFL